MFPLWSDLAIAMLFALANSVVPVPSLLQLITVQNKCLELEMITSSFNAMMVMMMFIVMHVVHSTILYVLY